MADSPIAGGFRGGATARLDGASGSESRRSRRRTSIAQNRCLAGPAIHQSGEVIADDSWPQDDSPRPTAACLGRAMGPTTDIAKNMHSFFRFAWLNPPRSPVV